MLSVGRAMCTILQELIRMQLLEHGNMIGIKINEVGDSTVNLNKQLVKKNWGRQCH